MTTQTKAPGILAAHPRLKYAAAITAANAPTIPAALETFDKLPDAAHVRLPVVAALKGISPATVWRWVKEGRIPAPVKLGPNTTAWNVGTLRRAEVA